MRYQKLAAAAVTAVVVGGTAYAQPARDYISIAEYVIYLVKGKDIRHMDMSIIDQVIAS